jgi:hypothetical protein
MSLPKYYSVDYNGWSKTYVLYCNGTAIESFVNAEIAYKICDELKANELRKYRIESSKYSDRDF